MLAYQTDWKTGSRMKILTAAEYYALRHKPEVAYIEINGDLEVLIDMDQNLAGTEQYAAFKDHTQVMDWVNATYKNILVEE
jgi:hypothetical protein